MEVMMRHGNVEMTKNEQNSAAKWLRTSFQKWRITQEKYYKSLY